MPPREEAQLNASCLQPEKRKQSIVNVDKSTECFEDSTKRAGLAANLVLVCMMCSAQYTFCTSEATKIVHENNIQLVYVTCSISKGQALGKTLCAITNLPEQPSEFLTYNIVNKTVRECAMNAMFCAVKEAVEYTKGQLISQ